MLLLFNEDKINVENNQLISMLYHQKNILNHVLYLNLNLQGMSDDSTLQSKVVNCVS